MLPFHETTMASALDLDECWDDLRQTSERPICRPRMLKTDWKPPATQDVIAWHNALEDEDGARLLVVKAPSPAHRCLVYSWCEVEGKTADAWLVKGTHAHFSDQIAKLRGAWGLLWGLIDADDLIVDEPLHGLIDQGFRFTELFQAIWEARFLLSEGRDVRDLVHALTAWLTNKQLDANQRTLLRKARIGHELSSGQEQLDVLFFLTALAQQNDVLDKAAIAFDGLDRALGQAPKPRRQLLRDLDGLIRSTERWARLGSPVGVMVGFCEGTLDVLQRSNAKLHAKVTSVPIV